MKLVLIALIMGLSLSASAQESKSRGSSDEQQRQRIDELEKQVKTLQGKVDKMESTLMKGGGFMIVANYSCELNTPFNGNFSATELSEATAKKSVLDQCRAKVPDKNQCMDSLVKCGK